MSEPALIVSDSGRVTDGLRALAAARGYDPVSALVNDRPEHGKYYLSPATVERIGGHGTDPDEDLTVVVDGCPHPGQLADLRERLRPRIVDAPQLLWERLADENPVAAARVELREARLVRRTAADAQRAASTRSPSGTSGRLADGDRRVRIRRDAVAERREAARERVLSSHAETDGRVVLIGRVGAPTTELRTALTGGDATPAVGRPARATTATATVGPHRLAVTDTPGVPGREEVPAWLLEVVPGVSAAIETAACVLGVGDGHEDLLRAVAERFDVPCRSVPAADAAAARSALAEVLDGETYAVRLPYDDDAHALVSELHDRAVVHEREYDDAIYLRVEVARTAADDLRRRVLAVDGDVRSLDESV